MPIKLELIKNLWIKILNSFFLNENNCQEINYLTFWRQKPIKLQYKMDNVRYIVENHLKPQEPTILNSS